MRSFKSPFYVLAITAVALHVCPAWAEDNLPEVQQQGSISYVSGGVGLEESEALEAVQHNYNLRIMSADRGGHFSGDTHIVVSDPQRHEVLDTTGGPLFYANLPNGRYVVEGSSAGQSKRQTVTIANGKAALVHFSWPQAIN